MLFRDAICESRDSINSCIVFTIAGLYAEQNTLIFKVSTSFLARILKPTHHMVNLSNESDQAWSGLIVPKYYYHVFTWTP
jgi:hypothetical protein